MCKKFFSDNFQTAALSSRFIKAMRQTLCLSLCSSGDRYEGPHEINTAPFFICGGE